MISKLLLLSVVMLALAKVPFAADPVPIKIKMMSLWQAGTVPFKVFEQFAMDAKAKSQGRLIIEPLPAGSVVAPAEAIGAVTSGVLDTEYGCGGCAGGKEPALALLTYPQGAFDSPEQMAKWMEQGRGVQLAREVYQRFKLHFIAGLRGMPLNQTSVMSHIQCRMFCGILLALISTRRKAFNETLQSDVADTGAGGSGIHHA